jgi:hypothetical protein
MSTKAAKTKEVATRSEVIELSPAPITQTTSPKYREDVIAKLGDEFGVGFAETGETFHSEFLPNPVWTKEGEFVYGFYQGVEEKVGPNESRLYTLRAPKGELFSVWGTTTLDRLFDQALPKRDDKLIIIFCGEMPTDRGLNPLKLFDLKIARA